MRGAEDVSRLAANSVVSGLWQGMLLAAGASFCLRLLPRTTAAIRFAIWTAVFGASALLPVLHGYAGRFSGATSSAGTGVLVDVRWSFAIAALWLGASLLRVVMLSTGALRLRRVWRRATPVDAGADEWKALLQGAKRRVQVCTSQDVDRPCVIGFFLPRILIPQELYSRLSAKELQQIVLHEMGHLRRGDDWMNLLQKMGLVLVPLNPVLVWIERRLCFERELACDEEVLLRTGAPKAYATCLANLAEHRLKREASSLSLGAWERRSELACRVHRILRPGERMTGMQARVAVGVMSIALVGGAVELSRCPQLVSFSGQGMGTLRTQAAERLAAVPVAARAAGFPNAEYQPASYRPVVYRPSSRAVGQESGVAHEVALKSAAYAQTSVSKARTRRGGSVPASALLRTKQARRRTVRHDPHLIVLTSFTFSHGAEAESEQPGMIVTVAGERAFATSYAALPTEAGWLVLQL